MAISIKDGIILTINRDNQILNKGSLLIEQDRIIDLGLKATVAHCPQSTKRSSMECPA